MFGASTFLTDNGGMKAFGITVFLKKENVLGKIYRTLAGLQTGQACSNINRKYLQNLKIYNI